MKRIVFFTTALVVSITCRAQEKFEPMHDKNFMSDLLHILAAIAALVLISAFLLKVLKYFLDQRLKQRLLDDELENEKISLILQQTEQDDRISSLSWSLVLGALGLAFLLIWAFKPQPLAALMILCFCLSAGLISHYLITKKIKN